MRRHLFIGLWLMVSLCCYVGCKQQETPRPDILEQIKERDTLTVLTLYSSTSYFLYRGQEMGYQYELSHQFARSLGVNLKVKVAQSIDELVQRLNAGEADLIAYNLPISNEMKDSLIYCGEENVSHQVIVQRAGSRRNPALTDVTQLLGKEVYVRPGKHQERLENLSHELGGGINIHVVSEDSISEEDLIRQVHEGKIAYTVSDDDIARLNQTYYPRLNVGLAISYDQRAAWAVRKDSKTLAMLADQWHEENVTSLAHSASMKRYFEQGKEITHSPILSLEDGKISIYDDLFKKYAKEIDWDWRIIASLAYTESNFDTTAVSWAGALGLMQLMPRTARIMGMPEGMEQNAEESIKAAVKYIGVMCDDYAEIPKEERIKFVLAAYNSGEGHVNDARALAEKYGADKNLWTDNVEKYLLLKSNEQYFKDPVVKFGYFRGSTTYAFVREILERVERYEELGIKN
ncbi:MAG: transglycosylase SLT domain-containing protein [Bacteroidaceae bacterium]|nr:transglycosylase SLT domain-containing protein [Bacteroidaceae bacterium]